MPASSDNEAEPRWHRALVYAVTGERRDDLAEPGIPEVTQLAQALAASDGALLASDGAGLAAHVLDRTASGLPWPHPVPADLMVGLGYAQFAAALTRLVEQLGVSRPAEAARVGRPQPMSAADRRLLEDVPPHHGG